MGSGKTKFSRGWCLLCSLAVAVVSLAAGPTPRLNHSFDIQAAGRTVCADVATYVGEATGPSALNILQTSEVWDAAGTTLLATGDSHTFTAVGETFTFTVPGSFTVGSTVTLSVTEIPGTLAGNEGDAATETVADCSLPVCGDGNLDPGETCDPADPMAPAGCRAAGGADECTFCGDGNQEASEGCDDGNNTDGDGCSAVCVTEVPTLGQWGAIALALLLLAVALLAGGGVLRRPGARGRPAR